MSNLSALVLAAGKGVRMKSALPKILHTVGGMPMVEHVANNLQNAGVSKLAFVVGYKSGVVQSALSDKFPKSRFFLQRTLDGSGGAAKIALAWIKKIRGPVIVTCGDTPLLSAGVLKALVRQHQKEKNAATVLTTLMPNPFGYGRIIRLRDGAVDRIVEELDATEQERRIDEINSGTYCFDSSALAWALPKVSNKNAKREYYLTDVLSILKGKGGRIGASVCPDPQEILGINSRAGLAAAHQIYFQKKAEALMEAGVTLIDPQTTYIEAGVAVGPDTVIWPQTFLQGSTKIGSNCQIGPWAHLVDTVVEAGVSFKASFSEKARIRKISQIGPFSRVRPKSDLGPAAHLGNFSEVKNARLGPGTKVNHLSYLGDAKVGKNVNIGAGTITCNYDGFRKYPTVIHDHAFIGSNANLIAPITVGAGSVVGAGSCLNKDVPRGALAFERAETKVRKGWASARAKKMKKGK